MATPTSLRSFAPFVCQSCRQRIRPKTLRSFATSSTQRANTDPLGSMLERSGSRANAARPQTSPRPNKAVGRYMLDSLERGPEDFDAASANLDAPEDETPHRLHVYATKHNTHLTLVQAPRTAANTVSSRVSSTKANTTQQNKMVDVLLSVSAGNIGFRKAGRGSYDAAFQLAGYALRQMQERGMLRDLKQLEVVLRGFGAGREAVPKALLGLEGRHVRHLICSVKDATRLKQGGPRSKKPRRLG